MPGFRRHAPHSTVSRRPCHSPRMLAMASTALTVESLLPPRRLEASTMEASTGWGCCRNTSMVLRQDWMRWGRVPPTSVSLPPIVSRMRPTSPMAPHWMATCGATERSGRQGTARRRGTREGAGCGVRSHGAMADTHSGQAGGLAGLAEPLHG